ncbi:MAG: VanW family protein [Clostridiales bacterium]|jgi:vancomycin resistance protein YoaR|nr:VanW family protein [Clostridiales bacterium]
MNAKINRVISACLILGIYLGVSGCGAAVGEQNNVQNPSPLDGNIGDSGKVDDSGASGEANKGEQFEKIGTCNTQLVDKQANRVSNVKLCIESINGKILQAGEEFSFNDTVGERTTARGYKEAYIFVGKEKEQGLGGGICQVSTTMYQSALSANLEVTERHQHPDEVTYIELGKDATVAYGKQDFKFKNTLDKPIKIAAFEDGGSVQVDIYKVNY